MVQQGLINQIDNAQFVISLQSLRHQLLPLAEFQGIVIPQSIIVHYQQLQQAMAVSFNSNVQSKSMYF